MAHILAHRSEVALAVVLLHSALLAACAPHVPPPSLPPPTLALPTQSLVGPTEVPSQGRLGPRSSAVPSVLPIRVKTTECVQVESSLPGDALEGSVVVVEDNSERDHVGPLALLNGIGEGLVPLTHAPAAQDALQSPDNEYVAYRHDPGSGDYLVVVMDADGEIVDRLPISDPREVFQWLGTDVLAVHLSGKNPPETTTRNVVTGATGEMAPVLQALWLPSQWVYGAWTVVFSPDAKLAAYPTGIDLATGIVLQEIATGRPLWSLDRSSVGTIPPEWNLAGTGMAVATTEDTQSLEVFTVSPLGLEKKWVEISADSSIDLDWALQQLAWSPDGRYLALVPIGGKPVLFLDTEELVLLDFCLGADVSRGLLLWAPDSRGAIVPQHEGPPMVVDVSRKHAYELPIADAWTPLAWLKAID